MRITRIKQLSGLFLCLCSVLLAALPGDLNHDGLLNVADLVRLQSMVDGTVSPTPEADLNFDRQVDAEDVMLLDNALRGNPLPVFLARSTLDSAGGSFEHPASGFRLDIPAGALTAPSEIVLSAINRQMLEDYGVSTPTDSTPLMLFGLPAVDGLELSFQLPPASRSDESWSLVLGNYQLARNAQEADWHFQLFDQPEDGISIENGKLVWRPQRLPDQPVTRAGAGTAEGFIFDIERNWLGGTFYTSSHFRLQPLTSTTTDTEMNQMQALLQNLENAFSVGVSLGFPENKRIDKWGDSAEKIKVVIKKPTKAKFYGLIGENEDAESAWCNPPGYWSPPWLELNTGVITSPNRREIVSHEFFHYLQYYYSDNTTTIWLDEMSATWMEGRVSLQGDDYRPSTYKNPRAPINGLYRASSLFSPNNAGFHGYSISAFAYYLSKRYDWKANFWHTVFSHADYAIGKGMAPLKAGANSMSILGLEYLYHVFLRNYLSDGFSDAPSGKMPFGSNSQRSLAVFQNTDQNEVDWKRYRQNGKISKIEKTSDLSGKLEQDFQIQDLGAATWLFTFQKPKDVIQKGMYARVQIDDVCSDLFAVLYRGPESIGITKIESVEHDPEKEKRTLDFSLAALESSDRLMNIGLVAVNADTSTGDAPEIRPAKMTVQFLGLIALPAETTWFNLWGERILQASADLEVTCETTGVLGEYSVDIWNGAPDILSPFRIVTAQLNKPWPQSIRIRSNIVPVDLGEVSGTDNAGYPFNIHAVPTESAKIFVDIRHQDAEDFYASQEYIVPLADLAAEGGYPVDLDSATPTDEINITIRPIYTVSGVGSGTGENLNTMVLSFLPPPPAAAAAAPEQP